MSIRKVFGLASMAALFAPVAALATDLTPPPPSATQFTPPASAAPAKTEESYVVTLQAIGAFAPSFPGAAKLRPFPFPGINVRSSDEAERFATPDEGFGLAFIDESGLRLGPVANFVFHRGQRDGLFGLHDVGLTHEVGGFAEYSTLDHLRARTELRQAVDGHGGFVAALGADVYTREKAVQVSVGPRIDFGNNKYANAYYSVTPTEAAINGRLEPYRATGGFTSIGGLATLRYDLTSNMNATLYGGLQRLTGSVGSSPIPNLIGSRDQFTAGVAISQSFEVTKFW